MSEIKAGSSITVRAMLILIAEDIGYRADQLDLCLGKYRRYFVGGKGIKGDDLLGLPVVRYSRVAKLEIDIWEVEVNNGGKRARRLLVSMRKFFRGTSREPALRPEFIQAPGAIATDLQEPRTSGGKMVDDLVV
jgi:hypothetical protein